ncbi:hypothetical protein [Nissabacter archeti]|nr:hypothetical protein [Nissabacter archeti]
MKKRTYRHTNVHKNLSRLDYCRGFSPEAAVKLRQMLDESKAKEGGK